jgi:hypothetical protein
MADSFPYYRNGSAGSLRPGRSRCHLLLGAGGLDIVGDALAHLIERLTAQELSDSFGCSQPRPRTA